MSQKLSPIPLPNLAQMRSALKIRRGAMSRPLCLAALALAARSVSLANLNKKD